MNEMNYWKQFFSTGRVEDYLKYKQCPGREMAENKDDSTVKEGSPYAGFYHDNRDSHKNGTHIGI